ncbi:hypothetical protein H5410_057428 [Solanum commersonii]|uniref:Uncharacterized protein n=1 Tax=Solanum commersonii TaxID=4109 RepID=A0A9J5WQT8_SOLCO|nr:hypothetical protein H5410_057428 [Solanum commersonii]
MIINYLRSNDPTGSKMRENYIYTYIFVPLTLLSQISLATLPDLALSLSLTLYKKCKLYKMRLCLYKERENCIYTYIFVPSLPSSRSRSPLSQISLSHSPLSLYTKTQMYKMHENCIYTYIFVPLSTLSQISPPLS